MRSLCLFIFAFSLIVNKVQAQTPGPVHRVVPSINPISMTLGSQLSFSCKGYDVNGVLLSSPVSYYVIQGKTIISINNQSGLLKANAIGTGKVRCWIDGKAADASATVSGDLPEPAPAPGPGPIATIIPSVSPISINVGEQLSLSCKGYDANGVALISPATYYVIQGKTVISIHNTSGLISAKLEGIAKIRCWIDGKASDIPVNVSSGSPAPVVNKAPVVNAGADKSISLPSSVSLTASASDDGLPTDPGTLSHKWSKVSGPGTVGFSNVSSLISNATFSVEGIYVLRFTSFDGLLSSSDEVTVTVNKAPLTNTAPVVMAGNNQAITLPNAVTLTGSVTDDGLPAGSSLTYQWSKASGPGVVTFGSATATATSASFSLAGTYSLRLTASDGALSSSATVTITVLAPSNQAPVVNAGPDTSVVLGNSLALRGSATDDGLPTGSSLSYKWAKFSGPGVATFSSSTSASSSVSFSALGSYVLSLTVSDGLLTNSDTVSVSVISISGNPNIVVNPNITYQKFIGWQASGETGMTDFPVTGMIYRDAVLDASVELGINRVRIGSHSGNENTVDYYQLFLDAMVDAPHATRDAWKANRTKPVNDNSNPASLVTSGFVWGQVDHQIENVVLPLKQRLEAQGESLYLQFTYVHFSTLNQLHIDSPLEYGEYILAAWKHMQQKYGFVPDSLEIFLEPDNGAAQVTPAELGAMIVAARNALVGAGFSKPDITAPSTVSGPNARLFYNSLKAANPLAATYIDEIGYHRYVNIDNNQLGQLRAVAEADGKLTSMSEYGGGTYHHLHDDLKVGKVSSWEQYGMGYPTADNGYQHFVVGAGPNYNLTMGSRTKFLRQYMKFIRRDAVMLGVSNSEQTKFDGLAFRNANGTYVVTVKALSSGTVTVAGLPAGTYGIKYTTSSQYDVDLANQTISAGSNVSFNMPAAGVVTIYNITYQD